MSKLQACLHLPDSQQIAQRVSLQAVSGSLAARTSSMGTTFGPFSKRKESQMLKQFLNWLTVSGVIVTAVILITVVIIAFVLFGRVLETGFTQLFGI
jgi:hypothetical protein